MSSAPNLRSGIGKGSGAANVTSEDGTEEDDTFGELPTGWLLITLFCINSQLQATIIYLYSFKCLGSNGWLIHSVVCVVALNYFMPM